MSIDLPRWPRIWSNIGWLRSSHWAPSPPSRRSQRPRLFRLSFPCPSTRCNSVLLRALIGQEETLRESTSSAARSQPSGSRCCTSCCPPRHRLVFSRIRQIRSPSLRRATCWPLPATGGKVKQKGLSKKGDRYLRSLLVTGAMAVARKAQKRPDRHPGGLLLVTP